MGIHFSFVLGIVWISASYEIFKKPINLKCLCFPILFPYNGNPLLPSFGNSMDFCFKQKVPETLNFEMFVFSHIFPLLWEFTFPIFWALSGFLLHPKYFRNPTLWNVCFFPILFPSYGNSLFPCFGNWLDFCFKRKISETLNFEMLVCFPYFFLTLWIHFPHIFGIVCINATHEICKKSIALECLCFPIRFPYYENSVISMFSELNGFLFHAKQSSAEYIRNRNLWNICVFP